MNPYKDFFEGMAVAPAEQMVGTLRAQFRVLASQENPKAVQLLKVLDDCVRYSLCSGFCIWAIDKVWRGMLEAEGKTYEQGIAEATWLDSKGN